MSFVFVFANFPGQFGVGAVVSSVFLPVFSVFLNF